MARKIDKQQPAAVQPTAADQLAVLSPNTDITVGGRAIRVREYAFFEGLRVAVLAEAFINAIHDLVRADGDLRFDRIRRLFGVHEDVVVVLAAQSADVDVAFVRGLDANDMETLLSTWFGVNAGFFVHEVVLAMREERQREAMQSHGKTSSSVSPAPASEPSTPSASSPSAS